MAKFGTPAGLEIAALKKKQTAVWDPMAHGPGTPWEDRATHGIVGAFLRTATASLTRPRRLVDQLRRPETTNDARAFVIGCGAMWGVSAAYHTVWALYRKANHPGRLDAKTVLELDPGQFDTVWLAIDVAVALAGAAVGVVGLWLLLTAIYHRLVDQEARAIKAPEPLLANVAAYALGPSVLALIPVVGPVVAVVAILFAIAAMGTCGRLRLPVATAVINAVLAFGAVAAIGGVGSVVPWYLSDWLIRSAVPTEPRATNDANQPAIRPSIR